MSQGIFMGSTGNFTNKTLLNRLPWQCCTNSKLKSTSFFLKKAQKLSLNKNSAVNLVRENKKYKLPDSKVPSTGQFYEQKI